MNVVSELLDKMLGRAQAQDPTSCAAREIVRLSRSEIEALPCFEEAQRLFAEQKRLNQEIGVALTEGAAVTAYSKQQAEHQTLVASGSLVDVDRGRSRQAWLDDFEHRRIAAKDQLMAVAKTFKPLSAEIIVILMRTTRDQVALVEAQESESYQRFGLPYQSSALVQHLRGMSEFLINRGADTVFEN